MSSSIEPSSPQDDTFFTEVENLSEEERAEILEQIENVASGGGLGDRKDIFTIQASKKGGVFPLVVNIIAVIAMAGGIYYANHYFSRQEEELNLRSSSYLSAESKIIEEFKKESEKRLQEKESEIENIRSDLLKIEQEREALAANIEEQIASREEELRRQLEQSLAEERERLENQGISEEEMQRRLAEFQEARSGEIDAAVSQFRSEMETELQAKEQELAEAEATAQRILEEANREREELIEETRRREEELQSEFEEEMEQLSAQAGRAREELEELSELRKNEQLVLDQISSMYLEIESAIDERKAQEAMDRIDALRDLIQSPSVARLPSLSKRREVDNFLISTLEEYVNKTQRSTADTSLLDSAKLLASAKASVESAQEALAEGDNYTAQRYFNQAISTVPEINTAHEEINRLNALNRGARVDELLALAEEAAAAGNTDEAADRYASAAAEASPANSEKARSAVNSLEELFTARLQESRESMQEEIAGLSSRVEELNEELASASQEIPPLEEQIDTLQGEKAAAESRIAALQEEMEAKNSETEDRIGALEEEKSKLQSRITELNGEIEGLESRYSAVREQADRLQKDLEEAANEIASMVSNTGTNSLLLDAVDRYSSFRDAQRSIISVAGAGSSRAERNFEEFLRSNEISSLFPDLAEIYEQSHR